MNKQQMDYMSTRISPILEKMCLATLCEKPENIVSLIDLLILKIDFMIAWLEDPEKGRKKMDIFNHFIKGCSLRQRRNRRRKSD